MENYSEDYIEKIWEELEKLAEDNDILNSLSDEELVNNYYKFFNRVAFGTIRKSKIIGIERDENSIKVWNRDLFGDDKNTWEILKNSKTSLYIKKDLIDKPEFNVGDKVHFKYEDTVVNGEITIISLITKEFYCRFEEKFKCMNLEFSHNEWCFNLNGQFVSREDEGQVLFKGHYLVPSKSKYNKGYIVDDNGEIIECDFEIRKSSKCVVFINNNTTIESHKFISRIHFNNTGKLVVVGKDRRLFVKKYDAERCAYSIKKDLSNPKTEWYEGQRIVIHDNGDNVVRGKVEICSSKNLIKLILNDLFSFNGTFFKNSYEWFYNTTTNKFRCMCSDRDTNYILEDEKEYDERKGDYTIRTNDKFELAKVKAEYYSKVLEEFNKPLTNEEETIMKNVRIVEIQLIDNDPAILEAKDAIVAVYKDIATEDDDNTTIQEIIMNEDIASALATHNTRRSKLINRAILNKTGKKVKLEPVKLKNLTWKVFP